MNCEELAVGHQPLGQRERLHDRRGGAAARCRSRSRRRRGRSRPGRRRNRSTPSGAACSFGSGGARRVRRIQRALRQQVLDVGEDQFLVLLLVLQAEFEQRRQFLVVGVLGQQARDAAVDVGAVGAHFGHRRARQQPALGARMAVADAVVVGVEQDPERRMERLELRFQPFEDEGLEEPGGVRQVPLDRAGVGHRLGAAVFVRQRLGQHQRALAHAFIMAAPGELVGRLHFRQEWRAHG